MAIGSQLRLPDSTDGLVYHHAAERLVSGEGLRFPYIWQYLSEPDSLEPVAFGYWMPLATFLGAASLWIFGGGLVAAMLPSILGVAALTALGYALAFRVTRDRSTSLLAAAVIPLYPWVLRWGLSSQAALASAVFGASSLLVVTAPGRRGFARVALAGVLAGLATLSRGDGVLVLGSAFVGLGAMAATDATGRRIRSGLVGLTRGAPALLLGFLLVMGPWYLRNLAEFGSASPPGASKALFIETAEDLYSIAKPLSLESYLDRVSERPASVLAHKLVATSKLVSNVITDFALLIPLCVLGVLSAWRAGSSAPLIMGFGYMGVLIAFYGLVGTEIGEASTRKSSLLTLPFWVGAAALGAQAIGDRRQRLAVLAVGLCLFGVLGARSVLKQRLRRSVDYTWIAEALPGERPVLMSRDPWRVWELLRWPSLQTPNDDLETILEVAERFGATYLYIDRRDRRPGLRAIYDDSEADPRFELLAVHGPEKLYRLSYLAPPP